MWTCLLGPFLSLLPESWRARLPGAESIRWRPAAFVSGVLEVVASLCALVVWYSHSVTHHTRIQIEAALRANPNLHPTERLLGLIGFAFVALNPVTWIICWFFFEGVVRSLGAAFTDEIVGTFPLWVVAQLVSARRRRKQDRQRTPPVPDEVNCYQDERGEGLKVMSCRPKPTWKDRPTIRIKEEFFQVEKSSLDSGLRPYVYHLRRLQPGEIIRAPENYDPQAVPDEPQREENILVSIIRALRRRG